MIDIHIDLETLDTAQTAVIMQFAMVSIERATGRIIDRVDVRLNIKEQLNKRTISKNTLVFWANQPDNKFMTALVGSRDLTDVFVMLERHIKLVKENYGEYTIWGNGATFDIAILQNLYEQHNRKIPWDFTAVRDCRTVEDLANSIGIFRPEKDEKRNHFAIYDAEFQGCYIHDMMKALIAHGKRK